MVYSWSFDGSSINPLTIRHGSEWDVQLRFFSDPPLRHDVSFRRDAGLPPESRNFHRLLQTFVTSPDFHPLFFFI